jgi:hypothetical protein
VAADSGTAAESSIRPGRKRSPSDRHVASMRNRPILLRGVRDESARASKVGRVSASRGTCAEQQAHALAARAEN